MIITPNIPPVRLSIFCRQADDHVVQLAHIHRDLALDHVVLEANPGEEYMFRERALGSGAITEIFENVQNNFKDLTPEQLHDAAYAKRTLPFAGEVYMGHLRYSTTGKSGISYVHPFLRRNNWRAKNLALCGNFNMRCSSVRH